MGKDIHVVSMDVETIAVIKKNKKIQHERMRQGNVRIIVIHPYPTWSSNGHRVYETVPDNRNDEA